MKRTLNTTVNRPTNATDSVSLVREWLYNRRSELAAASIGTNLYGYAYDTIGNRLWAADNLATNTYAANNLNQYSSILRGSVSPCEPAYDADGNMTGDGTFDYAYDAENRLLSATSAAETNGAIRVLNAYDHRNRRIRKTVQRLSVTVAPPPAPPIETREWKAVATHTFVWDGNNIVLEKVEFANGTIRTFEYFWGADKSGTEQGAGGVGGLLAVSSNGQFYFPTFDNNGNVAKYIDESGNVVAAYEYDDFGRIVAQSGSLADFFRHRFSTKYFDAETGLCYYGYRFYSPDWRIWLNHDPLEERGAINQYFICGNNPVSGIDSLGEKIFIKEEVVVKDKIGRQSRAFFFPHASVSFSCSWIGVLSINGSASRRIEIITPGQPQWKERHEVYNPNWGVDRTDTTEWQAAYAHEMDHWNSFNAFFAFLHLLNEFDGKRLCHLCNEVKEELEQQYNVMAGAAMQHSAKYDTDGFKGGGMYPKAK